MVSWQVTIIILVILIFVIVLICQSPESKPVDRWETPSAPYVAPKPMAPEPAALLPGQVPSKSHVVSVKDKQDDLETDLMLEVAKKFLANATDLKNETGVVKSYYPNSHIMSLSLDGFDMKLSRETYHAEVVFYHLDSFVDGNECRVTKEFYNFRTSSERDEGEIGKMWHAILRVREHKKVTAENAVLNNLMKIAKEN